jgi:hypothetical protein
VFSHPSADPPRGNHLIGCGRSQHIGLQSVLRDQDLPGEGAEREGCQTPWGFEPVFLLHCSALPAAVSSSTLPHDARAA